MLLSVSREASDAGFLEYLWEFAAFKHPWRGAPPLDFLKHPEINKGLLKIVANRCGLSILMQLTKELFDKIYGYFSETEFWRYLRVFHSIRVITSTWKARMRAFSLQNIVSWERGGKLKCVDSKNSRTRNTYWRITVDRHGIQKTERLLERPEYRATCSDQYAYVLEKEMSISEVEAQIKVPSPPNPRYYSDRVT
jgi:hypothetical protein